MQIKNTVHNMIMTVLPLKRTPSFFFYFCLMYLFIFILFFISIYLSIYLLFIYLF